MSPLTITLQCLWTARTPAGWPHGDTPAGPGPPARSRSGVCSSARAECWSPVKRTDVHYGPIEPQRNISPHLLKVHNCLVKPRQFDTHYLVHKQGEREREGGSPSFLRVCRQSESKPRSSEMLQRHLGKEMAMERAQQHINGLDVATLRPDARSY